MGGRFQPEYANVLDWQVLEQIFDVFLEIIIEYIRLYIQKGEYVEKHIPGAVSIPYKEKSAKTPDFDPAEDKWDMGKFPQDKSASIVVYCNGVKCWKSYKSVARLVEAGYTNVNWLRTGFPGWTDKGYPTE